LSWALPLSYYRSSTFLPCRISKPKMNKLGSTIVKNRPFWLLWHPFPFLRLKLDRLETNSIVTRELIPLFYIQSAKLSKPTFITICSTTFVTRPSILYPSTKKNLDQSWFFFYFCKLCMAQYFLSNEANNLWVHFHHLITHIFCIRFWWNLHLYFYYVYPTSRPKISLK